MAETAVESIQGGTIAVVRDEPGLATIELTGEFDLDNSAALETVLSKHLDAGAHSLTVRVAEVTFLDSTVLGVLLRAHRRCVELGGTFALVGARGSVARLIETTGLDQIIRKD